MTVDIEKPEPCGSTCEHECEGKQKPHTCPYNEEINEDYKTKCTCCDVARRECLYEI